MTTRYQVIRESDGKPIAEYGSYTEAGLFVYFNAPTARIKTISVDDEPKGDA